MRMAKGDPLVCPLPLTGRTGNNVTTLKVNAVGSRGDSPLMFAAAHNHVKVVQLLCACGADREHIDAAGGTIVDAAREGDAHAVEIFLLTAKGWSRLQIAVACGDIALLERLFRRGVDVPSSYPPGEMLTASKQVPVLLGWAPSRHHLFHPRVQQQLHTMLLVHRRLVAHRSFELDDSETLSKNPKKWNRKVNLSPVQPPPGDGGEVGSVLHQVMMVVPPAEVWLACVLCNIRSDWQHPNHTF
jgi:hypothetical protein